MWFPNRTLTELHYDIKKSFRLRTNKLKWEVFILAQNPGSKTVKKATGSTLNDNNSFLIKGLLRIKIQWCVANSQSRQYLKTILVSLDGVQLFCKTRANKL